jgi:hypothetical protein
MFNFSIKNMTPPPSFTFSLTARKDDYRKKRAQANIKILLEIYENLIQSEFNEGRKKMF